MTDKSVITYSSVLPLTRCAIGYLQGLELWLFTDNSTAESCFHKGGSSSQHLHDLVLRLRKLELDARFTLYVVHVAGMRMIAQGTDRLSRGVLLEGVMAGKDMLSYIPLAKGAVQRQPSLADYVNDWVEDALHQKVEVLKVEEWFQEGHGIVGGYKGAHNVWLPKHAENGRAYLWPPPSVIADVAFEECMNAVHKRTDAFHIFLIPSLFSLAWLGIFYKLCDFTFIIPVGSPIWPKNMHEPLFVGISLPLIRSRPWSLQGTPLLVDLSPVREMDGIFCANFSESRAGREPCQMAWHANCYECLGKGQFPMRIHQDAQGNT